MRRFTGILGILCCGGLGAAGWVFINRPPAPVEPSRYQDLDPALLKLIRSNVDSVKARPRLHVLHGRLGMVYEVSYMWPEARDSFRIAAKLGPEEPMWTHHIAICEWNLGENERAIELLEGLVKKHPTFAPAQNQLGLMYARFGNLDAAEKHYKACLKIQPGYAIAMAGLAEVKIRRKAYTEAVMLLEQATEIDPSYRPGFYLLGTAYRALGRLDDAQAALQRGSDGETRLMPDYAAHSGRRFEKSRAARYKYGWQLMSRGRAADAAEVYQEMLVEEPHAVDLLNQLYVAYKGLRDYKRALETLETAVSIEPGDFATNSHLAELLLMGNEPTRALLYAEQCVQLAPTSGRAYLLHGMALSQVDRFDEALAALETALRFDPRNTEIYKQLGRVCLRLDCHDDAKRYLLIAVDRDPDDFETQLDLCDSYIELGEFDEARNTLSAIQDVNPENPRFQNRAGLLQFLKDRDETLAN